MERTPKTEKEILKRQRKINYLKQAPPEEILSNTLSKQRSLFYNQRNKLYLNEVMPNDRTATDAFNKAKQYGTLVIPANVGKGAIREINNNSTIFDSKPSIDDSNYLSGEQPHLFIIEKDMKNHY